MLYPVTFLLEIYPEETLKDAQSFMYKDVHGTYSCKK